LIVSINQPAYLPWLGYFQRISRSDVHVVLDHVQFEKNSLTNRNRVRGPNGAQWLTVPVRTAGRFGELSIVDVEIASDQRWQHKHWATLEQSYRKAPHFSAQADAWADVYAREWRTLGELLSHTLRLLLDAFQISTPLLYSSTMDLEAHKSALVLEICQRLSATRYISGPLGRGYLDQRAFDDAQIDIEYHQHHPPSYQQSYPDFIPGLSAIDALFNLGPAAAVRLAT
jgi:hypothetical protein